MTAFRPWPPGSPPAGAIRRAAGIAEDADPCPDCGEPRCYWAAAPDPPDEDPVDEAADAVAARYDGSPDRLAAMAAAPVPFEAASSYGRAVLAPWPPDSAPEDSTDRSADCAAVEAHYRAAVDTPRPRPLHQRIADAVDFRPWPRGRLHHPDPYNDAIRAWYRRLGYDDPPPEVEAALAHRHADTTGGESPFPDPPEDPVDCLAEAIRFVRFAYLFAADGPTRNLYLDESARYHAVARKTVENDPPGDRWLPGELDAAWVSVTHLGSETDRENDYRAYRRARKMAGHPLDRPPHPLPRRFRARWKAPR